MSRAKFIFEPVLASTSRPKGSRSHRVREEIVKSRLAAADAYDEALDIGSGLSYLNQGQASTLRHESETESTSASGTNSNRDGGGGGDGDGVEYFEEARLSADLDLVIPRLPPSREPEMIGPYVLFRQISELDQDECKLRRLAEKNGESIRSMTQASEREGDGENGGNLSHKFFLVKANANNAVRLQSQHHTGGYYKMVATSTRLVMDVLESHGFKRLPGNSLPAPPPANGKLRKSSSKEWSVLWSGRHLPVSFYRNILTPLQRVNMFPASFECTKKDALSRNLNRMAQVHGKRHFRFATESYTLPKEREELLEAMSSAPGTWIVKPAGSSQGKGIYIIEGASAASPSSSPSPPRKCATDTSNSINYNNHGGFNASSSGGGGIAPMRRRRNQKLRALPVVDLARQLPDCANAKDNFVVERYIHNPFLIDSRKFDLRLYVIVTSFEPLSIFIHKEGLIRLASSEYTTASGSFGNIYSHLTNYSINKTRLGPTGAGAGAGAGPGVEKSDPNPNYSPLKSAPVGKDGRVAAAVAAAAAFGDGDGDGDGDGSASSSASTPRADNNDGNDGQSLSASVSVSVSASDYSVDGGQGRGGEKSAMDTRNEDQIEVGGVRAGEDVGIKLRLSELGPRMGITDEEHAELWVGIEDVVIKTLMSIESKVCVAVRSHCPFPEASFQMFGFDVLIDSELQPYLMEVNFAPSLSADSPLDFDIKSTVLGDTFTLCGVRKSPFNSRERGGGGGGGEYSRKVYGSGSGKPPAGINMTPSLSPNRSGSTSAPSSGSPGSRSVSMEGTAAVDIALLAPPMSEKEKKIITTFQRECKRAQETGFRLIYPRHGPDAARYLCFLEEGKEAALLLSHYCFSLRSNPSMKEAGIEVDGDRDVSGDNNIVNKNSRIIPGIVTAGDLPLGDFSKSTLKRITAEQIKAAREEVRIQERAWRKAIGRTASTNNI